MRPKLDLKIKAEEFINYYWLKEELFTFCKDNNLPRNGGKLELTKMIYEYLKTGQIIPAANLKSINKKAKDIFITLDSKIPEDYRNDENHRAFFQSQVGKHFKFNVPFMNWMKDNAGKTYREAIIEWKRILSKKKKGKKIEIAPQFEYNRYIRDFYKENPKVTREDAIKCWRYKKSLSGHNRYESSDLVVLTK